MTRNWTFGDWFVYVGIPVIMAAVIGGLLYAMLSSVDTLDKQEQQFANTFYAQCMKAHGVYSVGSTGYVCFGNGSVLFQSGEGSDTIVQG